MLNQREGKNGMKDPINQQLGLNQMEGKKGRTNQQLVLNQMGGNNEWNQKRNQATTCATPDRRKEKNS